MMLQEALLRLGFADDLIGLIELDGKDLVLDSGFGCEQ
jgi:hypothetical protein